MWILLFFFPFLISYSSVYHPHIFSKNIQPLDTTSKKVSMTAIIWGFSCVWIGINYPLVQSELILLVIELVLIQIAGIDGYSKIIPNRLLIVLLILISVRLVIEPMLSDWVIISIIGGSIISIQIIGKSLFGKCLVGWGDIKLLLVLVLLYEHKLLLIVILSFILAGLFALVLLLIDRTYRTLRLPLSPFFVMAMFLLSEKIDWNSKLHASVLWILK